MVFEWVKDKAIKFGTPHRIELILLFLYAVFFLWFDILLNKVKDLGIDYRVTWFGEITSSALDLAIVMLILFHIVLMGLFLMSLKSRSTGKFWDVLVGTISFFGVAMILSGFINMLYSDTIRFMFIDMASIDYYHIAVGIQMFTGLYYALTK